MLRLTAICHTSVLSEVVDRLQLAGVLQVETGAEASRLSSIGDEEGLRQLELRIARADFVRDFLGRHHESDAPFSTFISEKAHLSHAEFAEADFDEEFEALYEECEGLSARLATISRERDRLSALLEDLAPWSGFGLEISRWRGTRSVALFAGTVRADQGSAIRSDLREKVTELSVEELGPVGTRQAWVVMVHADHEEEVRAALALVDFQEVAFPGLEDVPAREIEKAQGSLEALEAENAELTARAGELEKQYHRALALAEVLRARHDALSLREEFSTTEQTFIVTGWVPEAERENLQVLLGELNDVDLEFSAPTEQDEPPVLLSNGRLVRPFEVITELYGPPKYRETDPTPILAFPFLLFFGLCLGDLGYGLGLFAVAWLIKHKLDVAQGVKKFMDLLMAGGLSAVVVGVFTGSYFAIAADKLPAFLRSLVLFDPVYGIRDFLILSVALGVVHILIGIGVKIIELLKARNYADAVNDEFSTLLSLATIAALPFVPGGLVGATLIVGMGLTMALKGRLHQAPSSVEGAAVWDRALGWLWIALVVGWAGLGAAGVSGIGWLAWALLALSVGAVFSRVLRACVLAVLKGALGVYGLSGLASDFLSYTRLAALGMASVLVGSVMNILAGIMPKTGGLAVIGIVASVLILVVGHAFNLVISLLGAFVHPLRLQFVEFFSKFYEGGGARFRPFSVVSKSLVLHPASVQAEGGSE